MSGYPMKFGGKSWVSAEAERHERRSIENAAAQKLVKVAESHGIQELEHFKFRWIKADDNHWSNEVGELKGIVKDDWELRASATEKPVPYPASYVNKLEVLAQKLAESNPIDSEYQQCDHCSAFFRTGDAEHDPSCLWLQANELDEG